MYHLCFNFIPFGHTGHANFGLSDIHYSQKAIFSFEKGSVGQNHSSSCSHHLVIKSPPPAKFLIPPPLLTTVQKTLVIGSVKVALLLMMALEDVWFELFS